MQLSPLRSPPPPFFCRCVAPLHLSDPAVERVNGSSTLAWWVTPILAMCCALFFLDSFYIFFSPFPNTLLRLLGLALPHPMIWISSRPFSFLLFIGTWLLSLSQPSNSVEAFHLHFCRDATAAAIFCFPAQFGANSLDTNIPSATLPPLARTATHAARIVAARIVAARIVAAHFAAHFAAQATPISFWIIDFFFLFFDFLRYLSTIHHPLRRLSPPERRSRLASSYQYNCLSTLSTNPHWFTVALLCRKSDRSRNERSRGRRMWLVRCSIRTSWSAVHVRVQIPCML
ncbi:uncharacterized protein BJ171DRAFT_158622 [Polychytrium aggregatum]|uniref:uncharacterized protein n=1 Tax=Polychytrium aggregatum TaxID=110093 RepID=UPI0022FF3C37|nr:uncharacterized protein BJ171DRAFT_158622 [Polychytrium aggregatum]KAI9203047.1 hypothetical protein BJ171DRAFT_158622 [Polychytrium aggregatum]